MKTLLVIAALVGSTFAITTQAAELANIQLGDHVTGTLVNSSSTERTVALSTQAPARFVYAKADDTVAFTVSNPGQQNLTIRVAGGNAQDTIGTLAAGETASFGWHFSPGFVHNPIKVIANQGGQEQVLAQVYLSPVGGHR